MVLKLGCPLRMRQKDCPCLPGIACWGPAAAPAAPASAAPVSAGGDEVVVRKRALKRVKQQVSALLRGEDLPEGAQARESGRGALPTTTCAKGC